MDRLIPLLIVREFDAAIAFYEKVFGATRLSARPRHADLAIGEARFAVTEEARAWNSDAPPSLGGSPVVLMLRVEDARATVDAAVAAGAEIVFPLQEFAGELMARIRDPFGHLWITNGGPTCQ